MPVAHKITAKEAIDTVKNERGLIKLIGSPYDDDTKYWEFNLKQLANPKSERPVPRPPLRLPTTTPDRTKIYNPKTDRWEVRHIPYLATRGGYKETGLTKKTSTSLIPADGVVTLFSCKAHPLDDAVLPMVGILFDVQRIYDLHDTDPARRGKENFKYVFDADAFTIRRWWLSGFETLKGATFRASTLDAVREKNRDARRRKVEPPHNEFFIRVAAQALKGVFATQDLQTERLHALYRKFAIREKLAINGAPLDLPVLIITPEVCKKNNGPIEYTLQDQAKDIVAALSRGDATSKKLTKKIMDCANRVDSTGRRAGQELVDAVESLKSGVTSDSAYEAVLAGLTSRYSRDYSGVDSFIELHSKKVAIEKVRNILFYLVKCEQFDSAKKLLRKVTDPALTTACDGTTGDRALHLAVKSSSPDLELITLLCSRGMDDVNYSNETAFDIALKDYNDSVLGVMIPYLSEDKLGKLLVDAAFNDISMLLTLLRSRADWLTNPKLVRYSEFATVIAGKRSDMLPGDAKRLDTKKLDTPGFSARVVSDMLSTSSPYVMTADQRKQLFLSMLEKGQHDVAKVMMHYIAPSMLSVKNTEGQYPLHLAVMADNPDINLIKEILALCSLVSKNSDGKTPLDIAIEKGHSDAIVKKLASCYFRGEEGPNVYHAFLLSLMTAGKYDKLNAILQPDVYPKKVLTRTRAKGNCFIHEAVINDAIPSTLLVTLCRSGICLTNRSGETPVDLALDRRSPRGDLAPRRDLVTILFNNIPADQTDEELGVMFDKLIQRREFELARLLLEKRPKISLSPETIKLIASAASEDSAGLIDEIEKTHSGLFVLGYFNKVLSDVKKSDVTKVSAFIEKHCFSIPVEKLAHLLYALIDKREYVAAKQLLRKRPIADLCNVIADVTNPYPLDLVVGDTAPDLELIDLLCSAGMSDGDEGNVVQAAFEKAMKLKQYSVISCMAKFRLETQFAQDLIQAAHECDLNVLQALVKGRPGLYDVGSRLSKFLDYVEFVLGNKSSKLVGVFGDESSILARIKAADFGLQAVHNIESDPEVKLTEMQERECFLIALQCDDQLGLAKYLFPKMNATIFKAIIGPTAMRNYIIHLAVSVANPDADLIDKILVVNSALPKNGSGKTPLDIGLDKKISDAILKKLAFHFFKTKDVEAHNVLLRDLMDKAQYHYLELFLQKGICAAQVTARYPVTNNCLIHIAVVDDSMPPSLLIRLSQGVLHLKNKADKTPIDLALDKKRSEIVTTLLNNISDKQTSAELGEVLLTLIRRKEYALARLLLQKRPDTTIRMDSTDPTLCPIDLLLEDTAVDVDLIVDLIRLDKAKTSTILDRVLASDHAAAVDAVIKSMVSKDSKKDPKVELSLQVKLLDKLYDAVDNGKYDLPTQILKHHPDIFKDHPTVRQAVIEKAGASSPIDWTFIESVYQSGYENTGVEKGNSGLVKLIHEDKATEVRGLLQREPLLVVGKALSLAIKRNALDTVHVILQERMGQLKKEERNKALDFILKQTTLDLSFLVNISGTLQEKRTQGLKVINYLLDKATDTDQVHVIVAELEKLKIDYLYNRQRSTWSFGRHAWNGEDVSHTWIKVIKNAKERVIAIAEKKESFDKPEDTAFLKKKRNKWGSSLFSTSSEKKFARIKKASIDKKLKPGS